MNQRPRILRLLWWCVLPLVVAYDGGGPRTMVIETGPLMIDRLYPSMTGPYQRLGVDFRGVDWITAFRTDVVGAHDGEPLGCIVGEAALRPVAQKCLELLLGAGRIVRERGQSRCVGTLFGDARLRVDARAGAAHIADFGFAQARTVGVGEIFAHGIAFKNLNTETPIPGHE